MKHLLFIVILVAILFSAGCTDPDSIYATASKKYETTCGGVSHTVNYLGSGADGKECCGNTLYPVDYHKKCCGGKYLEMDFTEICCGGEVYPSNQYNCCGNVSYNNSQSCCAGVVYNEAYLGCCNGKVLNFTTQHCCKGEIGPGGGVWPEDCGNQCYDSIIYRCCNKQLYNYHTQSCCVAHEGDVENNQSSSWETFKIHEGVDSCCVGLTSKVDGKFCQPSSGEYKSPSEGGCDTFGIGAGSCYAIQQGFLKH